jgi:hypothetical protein
MRVGPVLTYLPMIGVLSLIVGVLTLLGIYYTKKQVDLLTEESQDKKTWAAKHAEARSLVLQTDKWVALKTGQTSGYQRVFADYPFRLLVETYIVEVDQVRNRVIPRSLEVEQFLLPTVQEVIQKTIDTVERFKREHPEDSALLGL